MPVPATLIGLPGKGLVVLPLATSNDGVVQEGLLDSRPPRAGQLFRGLELFVLPSFFYQRADSPHG